MESYRGALRSLTVCLALLPVASLAADLYRYQDESGQWVFTDRKPDDSQDYEQSARARVGRTMPGVVVSREDAPGIARIVAENECPCPMQVAVWLTAGDNVTIGIDARGLSTVLAAGESRTVLEVRPEQAGSDWSFKYEHGFVPGDPDAVHAPRQPYLPPFGPASAYAVTQAFPDQDTHDTVDSWHAVDIGMPEGAGVYAARGGVVVAVAYANFVGGADREAFAQRANQVRILHPDGTFALYAHLAWDSIRVRPGQQVVRGEKIAASGNTGFSTGPHLHFAVLRNGGLKSESVPVEFSNGRGGTQAVRSGAELVNP
ncbi:MAG: peptidoglycan DD-metalloendopeptidase family protein [Gammaproteobacteria bacterium]